MEKTGSSNKVTRLGMVNYINTAPIYEIWKTKVSDDNILVIEEPPSKLNRMLANGEIDLGFVSSIEYAYRPSQYRILADLSISASGPVGSVFLFSEIPIGELTGAKILLSNQSETSVCLLKIILEEFYSLRPLYRSGSIDDIKDNENQAIMAIGDAALRLTASGRFPFRLDLGEIWYNHVGLPFVFSICAVREDVMEQQEELIQQTHRYLLDCRDEGQRNLRSICQYVAPRIPMELEKCYSYLTALEYDLGDKKLLALEKFFQFMIARGEVSKQALPLKIVPEPEIQ